jgi:hypothetical protein
MKPLAPAAPAKARTHLSAAAVVERWTPAFAEEALDIIRHHEPHCLFLDDLEAAAPEDQASGCIVPDDFVGGARGGRPLATIAAATWLIYLGSIDEAATRSRAKSWPYRRQPETAFETESGPPALVAGTGLHAPLRSLVAISSDGL